MQLVQRRRDLAPDAGFLRRVFDDGWPEAFEAVLAGQVEEELPAFDVGVVAQARVARFEFERARVWRGDHRIRVDGRTVFDERIRFAHYGSSRARGWGGEGTPARK